MKKYFYTLAVLATFYGQATLVHAETLVSAADRAMVKGPWSVVTKKQTPASGDKRDYMSLAPYFWPDTTKRNGLPYVWRDGEINPERNSIADHDSMNQMISAVVALARGYEATHSEKYANRAIEVLRVWFIASKTRMNPHLRYAQAIKGQKSGRAVGIIETHRLIEICEVAPILRTADRWTDEFENRMQQWFEEYLYWLLSSPFGKEEAAESNNHGTWYDAQVARFSHFVGYHKSARKILNVAKKKRIAAQIEPDGSMREELDRTKSWDYSVFNLQAFYALARVGEDEDVDLLNYETRDGRGILRALYFLRSFANGSRKWPYKTLKPIDHSVLEREPFKQQGP